MRLCREYSLPACELPMRYIQQRFFNPKRSYVRGSNDCTAAINVKHAEKQTVALLEG